MATTNTIAEVAALLGDPARAAMLSALMDGRSRTAGELARIAGIAAPTASGHLARLAQARLVACAPRGRQRWYRLASPRVAGFVESAALLAGDGSPPQRTASKLTAELRAARTCYDHLAGQLGVALADALAAQRLIVLGEDGGALTAAGARRLVEFGVDPGQARARRRAFLRPCLDWSERRPHLAGALGAALCARVFELDWIERTPASRAVIVTPAGRRGFADWFGIDAGMGARASMPAQAARRGPEGPRSECS